MSYNKLFEKGNLGRLTIKNRAVMMPMGTNYSDKDGMATDRLIAYYEERAKGGIGLIINEYIGVDDVDSVPGNYNFRAARDYHIAGLERLTEAIHKYDCKIFAQLHHGGMTSKPPLSGRQSLSPSGIPASPVAPVPREMTVDEIKTIQQKFIDAASRCKKAGYDGVELHGAHSYLIAQFFSKVYNLRTDQYGGSVENKCRFAVEIVQGIKALCGPAFVVGLRISGDEMVEGHNTIEDNLEIAKYIESKGLDYINVSNGCALNGDANCDPYAWQPGWKKHVSKAYKDSMSIPVIATNTIKSPQWAEQLLQDGISDFVGLGRSQLADSEFVNKAKEGRSIEIRKCIGCMFCREKLFADTPIMCAINPLVGCEYIYNNIKVDGDGKAVAVIGGGPGGMESAITLAKRGYHVTLFDKGEKLGGTLNVADKPAFKNYITDLIATMTAQVEKSGVEVILNTEATTEIVKKLNPVAVFVATGAESIIPPIAGAHKNNVYLPEEILCNKVKLSGNVCVVGTGMTGLETIEKLVDDGCAVSMIEMLPTIGQGIFVAVYTDIMKRINAHKPVSYTSHKLVEIKDNSVIIESLATGEAKEIACTSVVLSIGVAPRKGILEAFEAEFDKVVVIGDAYTGGRINNATKDGFTKAYAL